MLLRLLREHLRPYVRPLALVVLLQFVGTMAALYLPSLNADIIDKGVATGDTGYITHTGAVMLAVSLVQIVCSGCAVYVGARTAMGFGRDLRAALFRRVGTFSSREVHLIGAPSLITRNTNDVQQVQMLVMMTCTMMVAAPIMMVGGVLMAMREDLGLSWLLAVCVPMLFGAVALIISRMVPGFRLMQVRIDAVNRILREQITGIRVVRAFVREPYETRRFGTANAELTDVAVTTGRWMATMFPTVMLILNLSSVAVLWFGGHRVDAGQMQIGSLTAFLAYLVQILMSVMMATFMLIMVPRASVCADRIAEVLDTETSVAPPADPVTVLQGRGELELRGRRVHLPRRRGAGAARPVLHRPARADDRDHRLHRLRQDHPGQPGAAALRRHRRRGVRRRGRRAPAGPGAAVGPDRAGAAEGVPVLRHRRQQPADTASRTPPRTRCGRRWRSPRPGTSSRRCRERLDAPIAQGGTNVSGGQRQRLAIARALIRAARDLPVRRLVLGARPGHRRPAAGGAARRSPRDATVVIVAQRVSTIVDADQILVLEDGAVVGRGQHEELLATCPTYQEIVGSQLTRGGGRMSRPPSRRSSPDS